MKRPPLMPWPQRVELETATTRVGRLEHDGSIEPRLQAVIEGINAGLAGGGEPRPIVISTGPTLTPPVIGLDESYQLDIGENGISILAGTGWGAGHALTTLRQLLEPDGTVPLGQISDEPRFPWRGLMLDVARHFYPVEALERTIETMAFYKLNVLHLHLSDDQAFRFQSNRFPKLAADDSYTQSELSALVEFAAHRGIHIVPELDMPGHVTSWLTAYPEWGTEAVQPTDRFGVHKAALNAADEAVYRAIDELLGELRGVFRGFYIHVGGDEVLPNWWSENDAVQQFMAANGLSTPSELQAYFNARVAELAAAHGQTVMGWDEVLNDGAPAGMVVQSWRGATARDRALAAGHDCVVSSGYYLDLFYPNDVHYAYDPEAPVDALLNVEDALLEDPRFAHVADGMRWTHAWREPVPAGEGSGTVLGGEACLWSELVDEPLLDARLWSRLPMLAERFWSSAEVTDADDAYGRLDGVYGRCSELGLVDPGQASRALLQRFGVQAGQLPVVELLEPIKWYGRLLGQEALAARIQGREMPQSRPYRVETPLNRPVDALLPESFAARAFVAAINESDEVARRKCTELQPVIAAGGFAAELERPVAELDAVLKTILDLLDGSLSSDDARARIEAAGQPQGEYVVAIVPGVVAWLAGR